MVIKINKNKNDVREFDEEMVVVHKGSHGIS
jgi:hypothetical protein